MLRRHFLALAPGLAAARALLAAAPGGAQARVGLAAFSCHRHWSAIQAKAPGVAFRDTPGFYAYGRGLGADGVQASVRSLQPEQARELRARVEATGGCYEGDVRLPPADADLTEFEREVRVTREAGATVARAILMAGRRYETFASLEQFRAFREEGRRRLQRVEPVLRRHRLRLAVENHKDQTTSELLEMLRGLDSEWVGALVDTGNNIALLEEAHGVVEALAPYAASVHLKDMAVAPHPDGFLLSEVNLGTGFLDLPRMVGVLRRANPSIVFNLEMATRDPLIVPCRKSGYWASFDRRDEGRLAAALERVRANPPRAPLPRISGRTLPEQLADEEANNRRCLDWMVRHVAGRE